MLVHDVYVRPPWIQVPEESKFAQQHSCSHYHCYSQESQLRFNTPMLRHIILSIVFCSTAAAPVNDVVTGELWEDFGSPLAEEILRFLNPWNSPSLKQTIISCLGLLFISAALALPRIGKHGPALEAKLDAIRVLSGMSSPEFITVKAVVNGVEKYNLAQAYNRAFHKEGDDTSYLSRRCVDETRPMSRPKEGME